SGSPTRDILALGGEQSDGLTVDVSNARLTEPAAPRTLGSALVFSGPVSGSMVGVTVWVQNPIATGIAINGRGSLQERRVTLRDSASAEVGLGCIFMSNSSTQPLHLDLSEVNVSSQAELFVSDSYGLSFSGSTQAAVSDATIRGTTFSAMSAGNH